jgi:hypothetical protein
LRSQPTWPLMWSQRQPEGAETIWEYRLKGGGAEGGLRKFSIFQAPCVGSRWALSPRP